MVIVDHNKNIQRIIDVIKADSNVFDNGATVGLLRSVQFGDPSNRIEEAHPMPYVYVTTKESIQRTSYPYGITGFNDIPQITVEYKIVVVSHTRDKTTNSQKQLYNLLKNLRTTLTADPSFKTTDITPTDPIFTRSVLNQVPWEQDTIGQLVTTVDFILLATIGSIGTIQIDGVNNDDPIEIISKSPDADIEGMSPQYNDELKLQGYAPTGNIRYANIEIDHNDTINTQLRTLLGNKKPFFLNGVSVFSGFVVMSQLTSNIQTIDKFETDLIQFLRTT